MLQSLASLGGKVFLGAVGTVFGFVLMVFMLFFFIRDGAEMVATLRDLIPMSRQQKTKLFDHLAAVTRAMVYGTGLTALIQGALVGIAFLIVGLPSPLVFGVIAALAALLPFGGTALVWIPAAIVLAAQGRWGAAAFMVIWGALLVSLVDNVVRPMLVSGRAPGRHADRVHRRARRHRRVRCDRPVPRPGRARADHRADRSSRWNCAAPKKQRKAEERQDVTHRVGADCASPRGRAASRSGRPSTSRPGCAKRIRGCRSSSCR